jgi:hypothetical protein
MVLDLFAEASYFKCLAKHITTYMPSAAFTYIRVLTHDINSSQLLFKPGLRNSLDV